MSDFNSPGFGRVLKYHSNYYYVSVEGPVLECFLKGTLKKDGTEVLVGDRVMLDSVELERQTGRIIQVVDRQNALTRPKVANVDQAVIVQSIAEPAFDFQQLDRYLTHVALAGIQAVLCISKWDLCPDRKAWEAKIRDLYETRLGLSVFFVSTQTPQTLIGLQEALIRKTSVLAGLSGVGKSSLINTLNQQMRLKTGEISARLNRGQHTTRHVELLEVLPQTYIADTPGFSYLKFDMALPKDVESVFPEFSPYRAKCAFDDCLHIDEADCAVQANQDRIEPTRYQSYRALITEALEFKAQQALTSQKTEAGYKQRHQRGQEKDLQILRISAKSREGSRRTRKQEIRSLVEDAPEPL